MSVIYSEAWYGDMKELINGSEELRKLAPAGRIVLCLEVEGDGKSPYVPADGAFYLYADVSKFTSDSLDFSLQSFTSASQIWQRTVGKLASSLIKNNTKGTYTTGYR